VTRGRGRGRQGKPRPVKVALGPKRQASHPHYSVRQSSSKPPKAAAPSTSSADRHAARD
jgi:hypothetical protein